MILVLMMHTRSLVNSFSSRFDPQVVGGESNLLDIFAVAERFRETHPEEFNTLVRVPATFQKIHFERSVPFESHSYFCCLLMSKR